MDIFLMIVAIVVLLLFYGMFLVLGAIVASLLDGRE